MAISTTVRFLISTSSQDGSSRQQFLVNLALSLEPASEEDSCGQIEVVLVPATSEGGGVGLVPCSPGPIMDNPNPGG